MIYKIQILSHGYIPYLNKKGPIIKPIEVNEIGLKKLQKIYSEDKIKIVSSPSKIEIKKEELLNEVKEKINEILPSNSNNKVIDVKNQDYINQYNSYIENTNRIIETSNKVLETITTEDSVLGEVSNNNEVEEIKTEEEKIEKNETTESNIEENNEEESEDDTENTNESNSENNYNGRKRRKKR